MAASYWTSSHPSWLLTKDRIRASHAADRARGLTEEQIQQLNVFHALYIADLAKALQLMIRQRVVATACVYFRRFHMVHDFCVYDPRLTAPACLYLACKAEESQVQAKLLQYAIKKLADRYPGMPSLDMKQLTDLEMALLDGLNFKLTVFHAYDDILAFLKDSSAADIAQCVWAVVNDSYSTDAPLMFPPHIIALGCICLAAVLMQKNVRLMQWLESLDVDLNQVYQVTNELIDMYRDRRDVISAEACHQYLSILAPPS